MVTIPPFPNKTSKEISSKFLYATQKHNPLIPIYRVVQEKEEEEEMHFFRTRISEEFCAFYVRVYSQWRRKRAKAGSINTINYNNNLQ